MNDLKTKFHRSRDQRALDKKVQPVNNSYM